MANRFQKKDPLSLKVVYWWNLVSAVIIGVAGLYFFFLGNVVIGAITVIIAILVWKFLAEGIRRKKRYAYVITAVLASISATMALRSLITTGFTYDSFDLVNVILLGFLFHPSMRNIFIPKK